MDYLFAFHTKGATPF